MRLKLSLTIYIYLHRKEDERGEQSKVSRGKFSRALEREGKIDNKNEALLSSQSCQTKGALVIGTL